MVGRDVRVGFGVGVRVGRGVAVGSGVVVGGTVAVIRVGRAAVGGSVGRGTKYSSSMLQPVIVSKINPIIMIFLYIA